MRRFFFVVITILFLFVTFVQHVDAALSSQQRKELSSLKRELGKTTKLIRKKKFEEATKIVDEVDEKTKKIMADAKVSKKNRSVSAVLKIVKAKRKALAKAQGKKIYTRISFSKEIAPILSLNCVKCHGDSKSSGNLKLDSFASMKQGGKNGVLLVKKNPNRSLLVLRLIANEKQRMPKGGKALSKKEIKRIAKWIKQGAKFDGTDEDVSVTELATGKKSEKKTAPKKNTKAQLAKVKVPKATGNEKVSFKKDIAPFMVNLCLRCHNDKRKRGGLSIETVADLFIGGDSGEVIIPGNMEKSRFFRLVGGLENPRMPQGIARITRKNYEDMKTWFKEGNKYDGGDKTIKLRDLVPTETEIKKEKFDQLTDAEFAEMRLKTSHEQWKKTLPREKKEIVTSDEFYVYGNASKARLEEINKWAIEQSKKLKTLFGSKEKLAWKGKLTIFVMKDRFSYEEFSLSVEKRRTPREVIGHANVSPLFENAYVVLQDVGDTISTESPGMKTNLMQQLSSAYLMRGNKKLPDWITQGTGFALALKSDKSNLYLKSKVSAVSSLVKSLSKPEEIFANNTFSPSNIGAVGSSMVTFFLKKGGSKKYRRFVKSLQNGDKIDAALQRVYNGNRKKAAMAYFGTLKK